ncbi:MAG: glycolate oxidase subunit GlcE [Pseudomonadota bacterium]
MTPATEAELAEAVASASGPLEIIGGGTRRGLGRPVQAEATLSTAALSGITLYEPGALTLVAQAGTRMAEIDAALEAEGQMLGFEPPDHRALLGSQGEPTIGGTVAVAASGPRRLQAGACRDAMIGVRFVTGEGEAVKNGGRVMKNVTGYDLVKLMAGQFGTLGVVTEIGFKLLPKPEASLTLALEGLDDATAVSAMADAMATPFDVSGAAHLPGKTVFRVHGLAEQAAYRANELARALARFGEVTRIEGAAHETLWREIRDVEIFAGAPGAVWRLSVKPSDAPAMVESLRANRSVAAMYDWAGGLVWLKTPEEGDAGAGAIRALTASHGGHATLYRAAPATRAAIEVFEPEPAPLAQISAGLRAKFDPRGILNPGRMRA